MSDNSTNIVVLLESWFDHGDELALRRARQELTSRLVPSAEVLKVLSRAVADEVRQDVLARLLHRTEGKLRGVQAPIAYAKSAWRRDLATLLRKWGPRDARKGEVGQFVSNLLERDDHGETETRIDAARAIEIAAALPGTGRLAVLLTTRPDRITDEDWHTLVKSLPPPPPPRPDEALDREEASRLLYPPQGKEDTKQRNQRLNSFDRAFTRAVARIREFLEVEP